MKSNFDRALKETLDKIRRTTDFVFIGISRRRDVLALLRVGNTGLTEEAEFVAGVTDGLYNNSEIIF